MKTVRFGVVGIGNIGTAHATALAQGKVIGGVLTAVCDIAAERRDYATQQWHIPTFENYAEMLDSHLLDAVIISVPHPLHADMAIAALQAGLHVLVEKPIDITVSKAAQLNAVAENSGKVFGVMFNQRTSPLFQKAKELLDGGMLGEMKRVSWTVTNWYRTQHYYDAGSWRATWAGEGGGVLLNQAPHNLDIWQWLCGMPTAITAFCQQGRYHRIEVEDDVTIFARYANGATGTFITSTGEYPGTNRLEIVGDKGKIVLEDDTLKWWQLECAEREFCFTCPTTVPETPVNYSTYAPKDKGTAHIGILNNFTAAVLNGTPLLAPGVDGIRALTISNAAYLSAWTGKEVTIPFDADAFDSLLAKKAASSAFLSQKTDADTKYGTYSPRWQVNW
ncbi:MAG: Gfo/Idh/MocA family oxidoreductase [Clostridia bacterium]|nr:Gfo/Idh/MocA family oxidoreductase [Clostridia bacterium]